MPSRQIDPSDVRFFSGSSNRPLAQAIADHLNVALESTLVRRFSNDNLYIQLGASVRGRKVYLVQSFSPPVNDHLMELLMMIDIARSAGAREVHALIPYYSFARSDKKDAPRISITARLVADLIIKAGATHVMTMMLHSPQVHGFFNVPTDPLTARMAFDHYFRNRDLTNTVVVAPDVGAAKSAGRFADSLGLPVATGNKERVSDTEVRISGLVGKTVSGFKKAIIYDDEISTGSSMVELSKILIASGVENITLVCTHGVFVDGAIEKLFKVPQIDEIVTTDTVLIPPQFNERVTVLPVAQLFGNAILQNYLRQSLGQLFTYWSDDDDDDNKLALP